MQKAVVNDYVPQNEYVMPLEGIATFRSVGIIKAITSDEVKISVAEIAYEEYGEEEYQYIITPYWDIIDGLTSDIFHGIPGIKLELRLEHYYRVNCIPTFITERTPSKNREDVLELMHSVGLEYYDRFEWLLRTEMRAGNDNLIVDRKREKSISIGLMDESMHAPKVDYMIRDRDVAGQEFVQVLEMLEYGDKVIIDNMADRAKGIENFTRILRDFLCTGAIISNLKDNQIYTKEDRTALISILNMQIKMLKQQKKASQRQGIERAKQNGKYKGRKKIEVDLLYFEEIYNLLKEKEITQAEAMKRLDLSSRSTLYRRIKEYEKTINRHNVNTIKD